MIFAYKFVSCIVIALSLVIAFPCFAYAYLDPGTGSYILQILIATFFGILYVMKRYWYRIKSFMVNLFKGNRSGNKND